MYFHSNHYYEIYLLTSNNFYWTYSLNILKISFTNSTSNYSYMPNYSFLRTLYLYYRYCTFNYRIVHHQCIAYAHMCNWQYRPSIHLVRNSIIKTNFCNYSKVNSTVYWTEHMHSYIFTFINTTYSGFKFQNLFYIVCKTNKPIEIMIVKTV